MQIRILEAAEAAAFQALRLQGLQECPSAFASSFAEECQEAIGEVAARLAPAADHCVLGAFEGRELVGVTGLQRERHQKLAHKAFLWGVYVAPQWRKRGVGRQLVTRALAQAAGMPGLRQVYLGVNAANAAAIALYESLGFQSYGIEPGCMLLDGVLHDECHMVCVLHRV